MPTDIAIAAGQRTEVYRRNFSSIPATICFEARTVAEGASLDGSIEVQGSNWVFSKAPVATPLQASNCVEKGYWDTFYSVYVTAETDVVVTVEKQPGTSWLLILLLALVVIALAASAFFAIAR